MPSKFTTQQVIRAWFLFSLLLFGIAAGLNMRIMEHGVEDNGLWAYAIIATFFVWSLSGIKFLSPSYYLYRPPLPILCYSLFLFWSFISTLLYATAPTPAQLLTNILWILLPLLVLIVSYNTVRNIGPSKWEVYVFCLIGLIVVFQYTLIFRELNIFLEHSHLASSYFSLYLLPLIFLSKSKYIRIFFVILTAIVLISSVKRGGVLALALAMMAYVFCWAFVAKKLRLSTIVMGLSCIIVFSSIVYVMGTSDEVNNVFDRFENMEEDQGSNRLLVWGITLKMIDNSDAINYITGHGYNAVLADSPIMLSAHNDILEITYDYGVIGIVLYLISILAISFYLIKLMWHKSEYAPPLAMMLAAYLSLSLMSHVMIYFFGNIVMLTFGYIIGRYEYENMITESGQYNAKD